MVKSQIGEIVKNVHIRLTEFNDFNHLTDVPYIDNQRRHNLGITL